MPARTPRHQHRPDCPPNQAHGSQAVGSRGPPSARPPGPALLWGSPRSSAHPVWPPSHSRGGPTPWCVCVHVCVQSPHTCSPISVPAQTPPQAAGRAPSLLHPFPASWHEHPVWFLQAPPGWGPYHSWHDPQLGAPLPQLPPGLTQLHTPRLPSSPQGDEVREPGPGHEPLRAPGLLAPSALPLGGRGCLPPAPTRGPCPAASVSPSPAPLSTLPLLDESSSDSPVTTLAAVRAAVHLLTDGPARGLELWKSLRGPPAPGSQWVPASPGTKPRWPTVTPESRRGCVRGESKDGVSQKTRGLQESWGPPTPGTVWAGAILWLTSQQH